MLILKAYTVRHNHNIIPEYLIKNFRSIRTFSFTYLQLNKFFIKFREFTNFWPALFWSLKAVPTRIGVQYSRDNLQWMKVALLLTLL